MLVSLGENINGNDGMNMDYHITREYCLHTLYVKILLLIYPKYLQYTRIYKNEMWRGENGSSPRVWIVKHGLGFFIC